MQEGEDNLYANIARKNKKLTAVGLALFVGGATIHGYDLYDWKSQANAELQRRVSLQNLGKVGEVGEIERDQDYQKYVQELSSQKEPILFISSAVGGLGLILASLGANGLRKVRRKQKTHQFG